MAILPRGLVTWRGAREVERGGEGQRSMLLDDASMPRASLDSERVSRTKAETAKRGLWVSIVPRSIAELFPETADLVTESADVVAEYPLAIFTVYQSPLPATAKGERGWRSSLPPSGGDGSAP